MLRIIFSMLISVPSQWDLYKFPWNGSIGLARWSYFVISKIPVAFYFTISSSLVIGCNERYFSSELFRILLNISFLLWASWILLSWIINIIYLHVTTSLTNVNTRIKYCFCFYEFISRSTYCYTLSLHCTGRKYCNCTGMRLLFLRSKLKVIKNRDFFSFHEPMSLIARVNFLFR